MGTIAKVTAGGATHAIASSAFGYCKTTGTTAAKVATITWDSQTASTYTEIPFTLLKGVTIHIKFVYANAVANPTLNVNGTGAKPIRLYYNTGAGSDTALSWRAEEIVSFTYDGDYWCINGHFYDVATSSSAGLMSAEDAQSVYAINAYNIVNLRYATCTIASGNTSVTVSNAASNHKVVAYKAYQDGSEVIVDLAISQQAFQFSVASAATSDISIAYIWGI